MKKLFTYLFFTLIILPQAAYASMEWDVMKWDQGVWDSGIQGVPVIDTSRDSFHFYLPESEPSLSSQKLILSNSNGGFLDWEITEVSEVTEDIEGNIVSAELPCDWLRVDPLLGTNAGEADVITLEADSSGKDSGIYQCWLVISDPAAYNSPNHVFVTLHVTRTIHVSTAGSDDPGVGTGSENSPLLTMQTAINAASDGDRILVEDGVFSGAGNINLTFGAKKITLASENGPGDPSEGCTTGTCLDCTGGSCFDFTNNETAATVISGLTLMNSTDSAAVITDSSPTFTNCLFEASNATDGGAVAILRGNPIFSGCTFKSNNAVDGSAIHINEGSPVVTNCFFSKNTATANGSVHITAGTPIIRSSFFSGNSALNAGGLSVAAGSVEVSNTLFAGNKATSNGGGGYVSGGSLNLVNSTFYANDAVSGTALYVASSAEASVINTILDQQVGLEQDVSGQPLIKPDPSIADSDAEKCNNDPSFTSTGHWDTEWVEVGPLVLPWDKSQTEQHPYRLLEDSDCIDAGNIVTTLFSDIRGSVRPVDGDDVSGAVFDIGAYEYAAYYGGIAGDVPSEPFENLALNGSIIVTDFEYEISWQDKDPFPNSDQRVSQSGVYEIRLALVDDYGRRIDLELDSALSVVDLAQQGYKIPYTFSGSGELIGTWWLRLELASDPNQYVLSDRQYSIVYRETNEYVLGEEIKPPANLYPLDDLPDGLVKPDVDNEEYVYWSINTDNTKNKLYAVKPGTTVITWYDDAQHTIPYPVIARIVKPTAPRIHIADTLPVDLLPVGSPFVTVELKYSDNEATTHSNQFSASAEGWSVLLFHDNENVENPEVLEVVRTLTWDHKPVVNTLGSGIEQCDPYVSETPCPDYAYYSLDSAGDLLQWADAKSPELGFYLDAHGRLRNRDGSGGCTYEDGAGNLTTESYVILSDGTLVVDDGNQTVPYYYLSSDGLLVDNSESETLYLFDKDTSTISECQEVCVGQVCDPCTVDNVERYYLHEDGTLDFRNNFSHTENAYYLSLQGLLQELDAEDNDKVCRYLDENPLISRARYYIDSSGLLKADQEAGFPVQFYLNMNGLLVEKTSSAFDFYDSVLPLEDTVDIGSAVVSNNADDALCGQGYVFFENGPYDGTGDTRAHDRMTRQGPIYPVNKDLTDNDDEDDLVVVWYQKSDKTDVCWPYRPVNYIPDWPVNADQIVIASELGSGPLDPATYGTLDTMLIYNQPDPALPGYNPNEEHASFFTAQESIHPGLFPLRTDLNRSDTSDGYVLLKYRNPVDDEWLFKVYEVVDENTTYPFVYSGVAGEEINPFYPMNQMTFGPCVQSETSTPEWVLEDKDDKFFAKNGGFGGNPLHDVRMKYFYRLQSGYFYDRDGNGVADEDVATCIPWQSGAGEIPAEVTYSIRWPDVVPSLHVGETLLDAKTQEGESSGLPNVKDQCIVKVLFDQAVEESDHIDKFTDYSVNLINPLKEHEVALANIVDPEGDLPQALKPNYSLSSNRWVFTALPYHLQVRLTYDAVDEMLKLKGYYTEGTGEPTLLLNALSGRDMDVVDAIFAEANEAPGEFGVALNDLRIEAEAWLVYGKKDAVLEQYHADFPERYESLDDGYPELMYADVKGLTAGDARGTGYVTLVFNNNEECTAPTMMSVINVTDKLYAGEIKVIESTNPFEEKVTLRHNADFAGLNSTLDGLSVDDRYFRWKYLPAGFSGTPCKPGADQQYADEHNCVLKSDHEWQPYDNFSGINPHNIDGKPFYQSTVELIVQGTGQQLLSDNWFSVQYYYDSHCPEDPGPERDTCLLYANSISEWTPPQLYEGWIKRVMKKINLFDQKVKDFHASDVNTLASMTALAGTRYEGDIALSDDPEYLQGIGLIETYETLLNRGNSLDGGDNLPDLNNALLFAANRIADLYMLLGNDAFADASDPTIGFSTEDGQYGTEAPSIFTFQNQMSSLLEEELALLRGRDDVGVRPFYNHLVWNFTLGDGEVAYKESYNITDQDMDLDGDGRIDGPDGEVNEKDAMVQFPQGHGDAWGHYLSAIGKYYQLLKKDNFTWIPQTETILVDQTPVDVDYMDERKFAKAAAARARTGSEIINLTYRHYYTDDPEGQWQGYKDSDTDRAWGLDGWSRRTGQGALFDWVVGNGMLPPESTATGIEKVDRTTVLELDEIADHYGQIEAEVDKANIGLNPVGISKNSIPFDIDPTAIANGETHFEQIYGRAVQAMNNAISVFNHANQSSQLLRRQQDSLADFTRTVDDREADFNNRLIEVFGYPYSDDCGPGKTYPTDYCDSNPDLYHYMYVDPSELMGIGAPKVHSFTVTVKDIEVDATGATIEQTRDVDFHVATDSRFGLIKPDTWYGRRKAPGEIQMARSDMLQTRGRFEKALQDYDNLLGQIEDQAELIETQYGVNAQEITFLNNANNRQIELNGAIKDARYKQLNFRTAGRIASQMANAWAEALPESTGWAPDLFSGGRSVIRIAGTVLNEIFTQLADNQTMHELDQQQAKEIVSSQMNIDLTTLRGGFAIEQQLMQLESQVRSEASMRYELYNLAESLQQAAGRYLSALSKADRLLSDRLRFRTQTAAQVQDYRYKDMTFRIFRNDALQKYRAQFDLASMYVYLAAKAYDYETTLLDSDTKAGQRFLTDIVKQRTIGLIENGQPLTGSGLADPMKRMWQNFQVIKPQLGFNNPQEETNRFSLRQELFRVTSDFASNKTWRDVLEAHRVDDLWDVPEFRRYCRPFAAEGIAQPGIVIPFDTTVTAGLNYFGWPLGGGDSYYSATNFATKVRSVGLWFSNYNTVGLAQTPRIYLVPVGEDALRTPSYYTREVRTWQVLDQKLPLPFPIVNSELESNPYWLPSVDTLYDEFLQIRRHSDFKAYHDSGYIEPAEMKYDSRLIGRSVWNTKWLLIIPGQSLLYDADEGLDTFIHGPEIIGGFGERTGNGISDIKLFFETYSYSGN